VSKENPPLHPGNRFAIPSGLAILPPMTDQPDPAVHFVPPTLPRVAFTTAEQARVDIINQKIAGLPSLEEALDFLFNTTRDLFPCDRLSMAFLDESGERLVARWSRALYEPLLLAPGYAEDIQAGSLTHVIREGQPRIINDLTGYLARHPVSRSTRRLVEEGVRSSMTCPLTVEGRVVGVLFRSSRQPHVYTDRHIALHAATAERLGQGVEKAWHIEQLSTANRAYLELLGFVSHELKGPLASMMMDWEVLVGGYAGPVSAEQSDIMKRVKRQGEYLVTLVRDYLDLARIEEGDLSLHARDDVDIIHDVLIPAMEVTAPTLHHNRMRLVRQFSEASLPWRCDPELLTIAVANLLSNAGKYGRPDGEVRLSVQHTPALLSIQVWNEGPGFRESDRPALFRRFSRLSAPEFRGIKGSGVGLYTSSRIAHLHGGMIRAESEHTRWAEFTLQLPLIRQELNKTS
jgi:signal transduction histidine kinase